MRILYITYDGLTDFIGQSQVLPYLAGCARAGHRLAIISFEKRDRLALLGGEVAAQCTELGIDWRPQRFRSRPPYLAKLIDQMAMHRAAWKAASHGSYDLVHCRSYLAAAVGLTLSKRFDIKLLFDMRGLWADQRREGGRWADSSPLGRRLYRRWKALEAKLVARADHILSLTDAAKHEIEQWPVYRGAPISVIPCCADFSHFTIGPDEVRQAARQQLNIDPQAPVLAYLGSMGTVYRIDQHLRLFETIRQRDLSAKALFIGRDDKASILKLAAKHGIELSPSDVRVIASERSEVPFWLAAADAGTCLITPTYSSLGVSPTKLAEYLACGVPVIANRKVGDVEQILTQLDGGHVLADFSQPSIDSAADAFVRLRSIDRATLRDRARQLLDLPLAVAAYLRIYDDLTVPVSVGPA